MNKTQLLADLATKYAKVGNSTQIADATLPPAVRKYQVKCLETLNTAVSMPVQITYYVIDEGTGTEEARYERNEPMAVLSTGTKTAEDLLKQWVLNNIPNAIGLYKVHDKNLTDTRKWLLCTVIIGGAGSTFTEKEYCIVKDGTNPIQAFAKV